MSVTKNFHAAGNNMVFQTKVREDSERKNVTEVENLYIELAHI